MKSISIRWKLALSSAGMIAVVIFIFTSVLIRFEKKKMEMEFLNNSRELTEFFKFSILRFLKERSITNFVRLQNEMKTICDNPDILFVKLTTKDGATLLETEIDYLKVKMCSSKQVENYEIIFGQYEGRKIYILKSKLKDPLFKEEFGEIEVGFSSQKIVSAVYSMISKILYVGLIIMLCGMLASGFLTRWLTSSIRKLAESARRIGLGDLDHKIEIKSKDEIGEFAEIMNKMKEDLKDYIKRYAQRVAESEKLMHELNLSRKIQEGLLPAEFPEDEYVEVFGLTLPARHVGGDYYDFVKTGDGKIYAIISDAIGKGIPASLLMAEFRSAFKTLTKLGLPPDKILANLNRLIYEDTVLKKESIFEIFIAFFFAMIDTKEGKIKYMRGGVPSPVFISAKNGKYRFLTTEGIVIGILPYEEFLKKINFEEITIDSGDTIVFYTDGLTQALNKKGEFYGKARLVDCIMKYHGSPPQELAQKIIEDVNEFSKGVERNDDIALAIVRVK